jgi:hypothetical protein
MRRLHRAAFIRLDRLWPPLLDPARHDVLQRRHSWCGTFHAWHQGTARHYRRSLDDRSSDHLGYIVLLLALSFVLVVAVEAWVSV